MKLPYTIGHENAGRIHAVGSAVTGLQQGDKVILHPLVTCGLCRSCRFGDGGCLVSVPSKVHANLSTQMSTANLVNSLESIATVVGALFVAHLQSARHADPHTRERLGYAEYLKTTARSVIKLDPSLEPVDVAALADAGLTAYHAAAKAAKLLRPGNVAVIIGAGGLGHIGMDAPSGYGSIY